MTHGQGATTHREPKAPERREERHWRQSALVTEDRLLQAQVQQGRIITGWGHSSVPDLSVSQFLGTNATSQECQGADTVKL